MRASILIYAYKMYESSYESENAKDKIIIIMYFRMKHLTHSWIH